MKKCLLFALTLISASSAFAGQGWEEQFVKDSRGLLFRCENSNVQSAKQFGFKTIEVYCTGFPSQYNDKQYAPFKFCNVVYTRASGVQLTTKAKVLGKENIKSKPPGGYATIIPEVTIPYTPVGAPSSWFHSGGYKVTWNEHRFPDVLYLEACTPSLDKNSQNEEIGYCSTWGPKRANAIDCKLSK